MQTIMHKNPIPTSWVDLNFATSTGKVGVANVPNWEAFVGNIYAYTFDEDDYLDLAAQELPHNYKEGSDLYIHIHWATNGVDIAAKAVKWEIEYSIENPRTGVFASSVVISKEHVIPANTTSKTAMFTDIGTVSGVGRMIGDIIKLRARRITAVGNAPTNDPFGLQVGIHYQADTLGSKSMLEK